MFLNIDKRSSGGGAGIKVASSSRSYVYIGVDGNAAEF